MELSSPPNRTRDATARLVPLLGALGLAATIVFARPCRAEPYLAMRTGLKCSSCHVNRTGGGERNEYGAGFGRASLPDRASAAGAVAFDGAVTPSLRLGADLRAGFEWSRPHEASSVSEFGVDEGVLYAAVEALADRVTLYVDERVAPGGASSREAFALVRPATGSLYVKVGRFFVPFGLRLQDDEAATREATGFSLASSDEGVEAGYEPGPFSLALSVTNGGGGGGETSNGKLLSFTGSWVGKRVRAGLSGADDTLPEGASRSLAGVFGGARAGPVVFLAEWDAIRDRPTEATGTDGEAAHLEVNWTIRQGLTLRAWGGREDPDRDAPGDAARQAGLGVDWTPLPAIQVRGYYRWREHVDAVDGSGSDEATIGLHLYF